MRRIEIKEGGIEGKEPETRTGGTQEKHTAHARDARAYEDDAIDMIHHNERGKKKERVPAPKTEPEPDYESEGMIPHN